MPAFGSPYGHVRAKAGWVAGAYAGIKMGAGRGRGPVYGRLLSLTLTALHDPELPVLPRSSVGAACWSTLCVQHGFAFSAA